MKYADVILERVLLTPLKKYTPFSTHYPKLEKFYITA